MRYLLKISKFWQNEQFRNLLDLQNPNIRLSISLPSLYVKRNKSKAMLFWIPQWCPVLKGQYLFGASFAPAHRVKHPLNSLEEELCYPSELPRYICQTSFSLQLCMYCPYMLWLVYGIVSNGLSNGNPAVNLKLLASFHRATVLRSGI